MRMVVNIFNVMLRIWLGFRLKVLIRFIILLKVFCIIFEEVGLLEYVVKIFVISLEKFLVFLCNRL